MNIGSVNNSALLGIQRGFDKMNTDAAKIASASTLGSSGDSAASQDLTRTLVGLQENTLNVQASTKAFSTQDRMIGTLLNEIA